MEVDIIKGSLYRMDRMLHDPGVKDLFIDKLSVDPLDYLFLKSRIEEIYEKYLLYEGDNEFKFNVKI